MILIKSAQDCCGCTACSSICPKDAISMQPNEQGFLYPVIDQNKCINCNLCNKVCNFQNYNVSLVKENDTHYYAVRHKNHNILLDSQSGGIFTAISDFILEGGGVIYGAGYGDNFEIIHKRATSKDQRNEFRGSKYVQSNLNGIFIQIKKDLVNGLTVLFSGTPCQVAGLKSFINSKHKDKLYLVDIICHGVPSPMYWKDYLNVIRKKIGNFQNVNFRDKKSFGWDTTYGTFTLENGRKIKSPYPFYNDIMFRESCNRCPYTNLTRNSDITIGDYWGIERANITFNNDNKGCSLVICNTSKGYDLFKEISKDIYSKEVTVNECIQPNLTAPSSMHPRHSQFIKYYNEKGFEYAMRKTHSWGWKSMLRKKIRKIINIIKRNKSIR